MKRKKAELVTGRGTGCERTRTDVDHVKNAVGSAGGTSYLKSRRESFQKGNSGEGQKGWRGSVILRINTKTPVRILLGVYFKIFHV